MLTRGNTAKLYCLQLLEEQAARKFDLSILDLGCGDGRNFAELLRRRPDIRYVGIEPDWRAAELARRTLPAAEIVETSAYDVRCGPFDVVVSFSVLEHVVHRLRYLEAVRANLAPTSLALLNYDSGHFVADRSLREGLKGIAGRVLARAGSEARYQAFVGEHEFRALVETADLRIAEARSFNTDLKRLYPLLPEAQRLPFMERWLELELSLGELGIEYRDELASIFRTRNFVLEPA